MSDASPSKRRKTKGTPMKFKKSLRKYKSAILAQRPLQLSVMGYVNRIPALIWPAELLPVEIFTLIINHLPRSNIQTLRLVNKEFDQKVSAELFKVVVVPFRPEIYGITPDTAPTTNDGAQGSVMLQDKGMRVFQGSVGRNVFP
jgi:hypothetical protein